MGPAMQRDTILAMDFMEGGSLWDLLPRTNKAGQRPFQFQNRRDPLNSSGPCPHTLTYLIRFDASRASVAALRCKGTL